MTGAAYTRGAVAVMCALFIMGIMLILFSGSIGDDAGGKALRENGGAMDTAAYERVVDTTVQNYRMVGLVVSLTGGFGAVLNSYALGRETLRP